MPPDHRKHFVLSFFSSADPRDQVHLAYFDGDPHCYGRTLRNFLSSPSNTVPDGTDRCHVRQKDGSTIRTFRFDRTKIDGGYDIETTDVAAGGGWQRSGKFRLTWLDVPDSVSFHNQLHGYQSGDSPIDAVDKYVNKEGARTRLGRVAVRLEDGHTGSFALSIFKVVERPSELRVEVEELTL